MQRKICPLFQHNGDESTKDKTNCGVCVYYNNQPNLIGCKSHGLLKHTLGVLDTIQESAKSYLQ